MIHPVYILILLFLFRYGFDILKYMGDLGIACIIPCSNIPYCFRDKNKTPAK